MKWSFLLLLLFTFSALGQVRHLVIDVDGFLVQGIPARNAQAFKDKERVLKATENGTDRYYYPAPYAEQVLRGLQAKPQLAVHFVSVSNSRAWLQSVLNKIYIDRPKGITLENFVEKDDVSKFLGKEDLQEGKLNLKKISSDLQNILFFTAKKGSLSKGQEAQEIFLGPPFYVFETFEAAKAEAERVKSSENIPPTREEWYFERHRFPLINYAARRALKSKEAFSVQLKKLLKDPTERMVQIGIKQIQENWKEVGPGYIVEKKQITGCGEFDNSSDALLRELPLENCVDSLPYEPRLLAQNGGMACGLYSTEHNLLIKKTKIEECLKKLDPPVYWVGRERNQCAYYTPELQKIISTDQSKCSVLHVMKNPGTGAFEVVEESEDFDKLTLEEIFNKDLPTENNVFKLWAPRDNKPEVGFTLQDCRDPSAGYHTIKEDAKGLVDKCKPDTLYSWGPVAKKDNLELWMGQKEWVKSMRPLFMTRSPVGSFGYGVVPIRIKLRPNLRWVKTTNSHSHCDSQTEEAKQNTVFYRPYGVRAGGTVYLLDYTVCSPGPIASWSYANKEHYDEIVKEYVWIKVKPETQFELYLSGSDALRWFYEGIDGYSFSESTLVTYLRYMLKMIERKEGKIHWNPSVPVEKRTAKEHFSTTVPMYYNHR